MHQGVKGQKQAGGGCPHEDRQEPAIEHGLVDGLHGGDATDGVNPGQGLHHEIGEGKEQPAQHPAGDGGEEGQQEGEVVYERHGSVPLEVHWKAFTCSGGIRARRQGFSPRPARDLPEEVKTSP
ncbi:hypothetical protein D3C84_848910 [compost metagenome]